MYSRAPYSTRPRTCRSSSYQLLPGTLDASVYRPLTECRQLRCPKDVSRCPPFRQHPEKIPCIRGSLFRDGSPEQSEPAWCKIVVWHAVSVFQKPLIATDATAQP